MIIYDLARKMNKYLKSRRKADSGRFLSPVRRIERTAPLNNGLYVAMTFDDGPSALPPNPPSERYNDEAGLTSVILDILNSYDSKGTFNVIGTTEFNYPDSAGKPDSFSWGGLKFDHYPDFGYDKLAGIKNQLDLAKKMISSGHELSNHGYKHILFGPMKVVYGQREYFKTLGETIDDLSTLHNLIIRELDYKMKFGRPPHYIDKMPDGNNSYDAYKYMGYQYLAAGFDGGGWKPTSGNYENDIDAMIKPLEEALNKDPKILNGQIIFQKDGCNMSRQTPVAHALERYLRLLKQYGYKVVTASELLSLSPFEDIDNSDPVFDSVRSMEQAGYCIGYKNNTFQPDRILTHGELLIMITPPQVFQQPFGNMERQTADVFAKHPYSQGINWAINENWFEKIYRNQTGFNPDLPVNISDFTNFLNTLMEGRNSSWNLNEQKNFGVVPANPNLIRRRDAITVLEEIKLSADFVKI